MAVGGKGVVVQVLVADDLQLRRVQVAVAAAHYR